jgi:hypothetical protein
MEALVKTKHYQMLKKQKTQGTASPRKTGINNHQAEGPIRQIHDFLDDYQKKHGSFDSLEQANKVLAGFIKKLNEKK